MREKQPARPFFTPLSDGSSLINPDSLPSVVLMQETIWMNGRLIPASEACVSIWDRSWLYGDGLFESVRIHHGKPFRWPDHWRRLSDGARHLRLTPPYQEGELKDALDLVVQANQLESGMGRIHLSRGVGVRGYSTRGAHSPVVVIAALPFPRPPSNNSQRLTLHLSSIRLLTGDPVGAYKTASKLSMILAQQEAEEAGASAALLTDGLGDIAESSRGNLFWVEPSGRIATSPLSTGILDGVTRRVVLEICDELDLEHAETRITPSQLISQRGAFVTGSGFGLEAVAAINQTPMPPPDPLERLQSRYLQRLELGH
jgi:branched-chain amino acid aminotransferase